VERADEASRRTGWTIDILTSGYVHCDRDGWQISTEGRDFLRALEAVTQDNRPVEAAQPESDDAENTARPRAALVVAGHPLQNPAALTPRSPARPIRSRPGKNDSHHSI
jgi:hypothetical protein